MSKQYTVDMNIDVSKLHPSGGLLMKPVEKDVDERGFKENTAPEIFVMVVDGAIKGSNQRVSYDQLKGFRKASQKLKDSTEKGSFEANKTEIDLMKNAIKGNPSWPNTDEMENVLDMILEKLSGATLDADATPNSEG